MSLSKRLWSEFLGTLGLLVIIVGSGIMGEELAQGNAGIALLANSISTGSGLYALIQTFGPISGAHLNPSVSLIEWLWKRISVGELLLYTVVQCAGAVAGVILTHAMFGLKILQLSAHDRSAPRFYLSECVATFGLIAVISLSGRKHVEAAPSAIALYITAAYWCTSSTAFANPAVTIARSLTNTFSGVLWTGIPGFIVAQIVGALLAFWVTRVLSKSKSSRSTA